MTKTTTTLPLQLNARLVKIMQVKNRKRDEGRKNVITSHDQLWEDIYKAYPQVDKDRKGGFRIDSRYIDSDIAVINAKKNKEAFTPVLASPETVRQIQAHHRLVDEQSKNEKAASLAFWEEFHKDYPELDPDARYCVDIKYLDMGLAILDKPDDDDDDDEGEQLKARLTSSILDLLAKVAGCDDDKPAAPEEATTTKH